MQQQPEIVPYQDHRLVFDRTVEQIKQQGDDLIKMHKEKEDYLANLPIEQWNIDTVQEMNQLDMDFSTEYGLIYLMSNTHPSKEIRDSCTEAQQKIQKYSVESSLREDLFLKLKEFQQKINNDQNKLGLSRVQLRYIDKNIISYKRSGLDLPKDKKERMEALQKEMGDLKTKFNKNLNEDTQFHLFTKVELNGMSDSFLEKLTKEGDKYKVTIKYPDLIPILENCKVPETRKIMDYLSGRKGGEENVQFLQQVVELRIEQVNLLGYDNFADFSLELKMAKNKENVWNFINELTQRLIPFATKELEHMIEIKKQDCEKNGLEFDGKINSWDNLYYKTLLLENEYKIDHEKISEYFPLSQVLKGTFEIYQTILGLRFEEQQDCRKMHEDIKCFQVYDSQTNSFMGHFYLDLYPRDGKYGHAAVFPTQRGQQPCCAMVCNFTKPTSDKPSLLKHDEVETFFHEFGHVMHNICTEAEIYNQSGTQVEKDFVEAPSQMLENWTYEVQPLNMLSGHYKDLSQKLPKDYLESIIKARNVNTGMFNLRQLFFGTFDMTIHSSSQKYDLNELWAKLRKEITLIEQQEGTHPASNFAHIMGGYEASYYGYLWSQVFSADMFEGGFQGDYLSPVHGMRYRKCILAPGGSIDGMDMIKNFLGREPNQTAFLKSIGIAEEQPKL